MGNPPRILGQCSRGLCLRYCSIGHGDLRRHDFCNPRRNTGHLRLDLGSRGANQNFTLQILAATLPATNITNFSTRASVQTGEGVTIAGFIIGGTGSKSVVVRGLGSTLAQPPFNVPGVLADPTLQLFDSGGHPFWFNDNWKDAQQAQLQSTALAPANDLESGYPANLAAGQLYRHPFRQEWHHRCRFGRIV